MAEVATAVPHEVEQPLVDKGVVKGFLIWAMIWVVVATLVGLFVALKLLYPDFLGGISWLGYGRLRIVHTNGVAYGGLVSGFVGLLYYIVPRLTGTPLNPLISRLTLWVWQALIVASVVTMLAGFNTGLEYAEMAWQLDIIIWVALLLVTLNIFRSILNRKEPQLYVSLWYISGALVWSLMNYGIGNFVPLFWARGIDGAAVSGFYIHNFVGLTVTPLGLAIAYYLFPTVTRNPLYSHKLSLFGFYSLALFYPFTGAHHFIYSAIPTWVQTLAIVFSVLLILPVWTVVANFFGTMRGKWHLITSSFPVKWLLFGTVFYVITCIQGPFQALATVQPYVHFTDWVVGHAHTALLGTFYAFVVAGVYAIWPVLTGRRLYSPKLGTWHFWMTVVPFALFILSLWTVGLIEGTVWQTTQSFYTPIEYARSYWVVRAVSGGLIILAQILFFANLLMTGKRGAPIVYRGA